MKQYSMWMAIALMMAAAIGCSSDDSTEQDDPVLRVENNELKYINLTRTERQLVSGNNDFAFNLFREVAKTSEGAAESRIVSPISITYALGMLNNGAAGETQAEIVKVLGFATTAPDSINSFCRKMLNEAPHLDKLTKVLIANSIFMNQDYVLQSDFISKAKQFYDADVETRDFSDGQTRGVINKWGSDHTEGMIPEVLKPSEFKSDAVSYLLNAIYFKGAWSEKFNKSNTKNETFKGYGVETQVPVMHQENEFGYTETDDCQALCLPYGNRAYSMTILLPKEGKSIQDVVKTLTADTWKGLRYLGRAKVDVKLPSFESQSDIKLEDIMSALGMPKAFDANLANFSKFCNVPTYIDMMKQVAKIKLNEEGTEAAAITVIGMENTASWPMQQVKFYATRPFLYIISEQSTGAIFFIGQYVGD